MTDYNTPIRYEGPSPRRRPATLLLIFCAVVLLAAGLTVASLLRPATNSGPRKLPQVSLGATKVGQPLKWRQLERRRILLPIQSGSLGGLVAGNFDTDADQELLRVGPKYSYIFEADGGRTRVPLHGPEFIMSLAAWDFDGDGMDEIVPDSIAHDVWKNRKLLRQGAAQLPTATPVYRLDGALAATLNGITVGMEALTGDLNADGHRELLLADNSKWFVYGRQGKLLATITTPSNSIVRAIGDPDGDGKDELLGLENKASTLAGYGMSGARTEYQGNANGVFSRGCIDVTGDGRDEMLIGGKGLHRFDRGTVSFTYPAPAPQLPESQAAAAGDFLSKGAMQIATISGPQAIPWGT
jgi:hypothetical protein